jgi:hypothetical protein
MKGTLLFVFVVAVLSLSACGMIGGSSPATVNDIPTFPGATELKAGDSRVADTLSKNSQQITAMSGAMGAGGKTEQKGFALPKEATWDAVKKFYDDKLKSAGWAEPSSMVSNVLSQVNGQNDAFQTVIYTRGNQSLSIIRVMIDPINKDMALIYSLTTR